MKPLTTAELLQAWEYGPDMPLLQRSLYLLSVAATPGETDAALLSIGQRDIRLLQLREWLFGAQLANTAVCPKCGERVEWENEVSDFRLQPLLDGTTEKIFELGCGDYFIRFRLPNSKDLARLQDKFPHDDNAALLQRLCLLEAKKNNEPCEVSELPDSVWQAMETEISQADTQADITLLLNCPACKHEWAARFDIQQYLWTEINAWAKNLLQEVYILARYFGWGEQEILQMKPQRRQLYLEMIFA